MPGRLSRRKMGRKQGVCVCHSHFVLLLCRDTASPMVTNKKLRAVQKELKQTKLELEVTKIRLMMTAKAAMRSFDLSKQTEQRNSATIARQQVQWFLHSASFFFPSSFQDHINYLLNLTTKSSTIKVEVCVCCYGIQESTAILHVLFSLDTQKMD